MSDEYAELDAVHMAHAIELAANGRGRVEPNPMVGCVIVRDDEVVGTGWHTRFGGPHAEVEALEQAANKAQGATLYVSLEPCSHEGKTPPCTLAVIAAGVTRVVAAMEDPFPEVAGRGLEQLREAGLIVQCGLLSESARWLNAPYLKLVEQRRPWVIAKWAMTLDGHIATATGDSRWISNEPARKLVHELRGRVDAVLVGSGTAQHDDPQLTARPPGPRTALRVVVDGQATLPLESQLVQTAGEIHVLVAVAADAPAERVERLNAAGCEVFVCAGQDHRARVESLLDELGRRRMTNVLVEGGGGLLGNLFDAGAIDEVHCFLAPRLIGGRTAPAPVAGQGVAQIAAAWSLSNPSVRQLADNLYIAGRVQRESGMR